MESGFPGPLWKLLNSKRPGGSVKRWSGLVPKGVPVVENQLDQDAQPLGGNCPSNTIVVGIF